MVLLDQVNQKRLEYYMVNAMRSPGDEAGNPTLRLARFFQPLNIVL